MKWYSPNLPSRKPVVASKSDKMSSSAPFAVALPNNFLFSPGVAQAGNSMMTLNRLSDKNLKPEEFFWTVDLLKFLQFKFVTR
jgi:hypothetical protein